ncbi:Protein CHROMOSOME TRANSMISSION FIDELITY 7 [Linum grandiflorum]
MMEIELGEGWIFHDLCKVTMALVLGFSGVLLLQALDADCLYPLQVYLYVSSNRIAGCLVAEPIKEAFKTISSSVNKKADTEAGGKESSTEPRALKFGDVIFKREAVKKIPSTSCSEAKNENHYGAMVCEERGVPAACGIRAIWVTPSNRRKGIATRLLDAARKSFCTGCTLERSQIAFSPPTSAGRPLADAYVGNEQLLLYKADPVVAASK